MLFLPDFASRASRARSSLAVFLVAAFSRALRASASAAAVCSRHKDGNDGKEVLLELCLVARLISFTENHECDSLFAQDALDELELEAAEAVAVTDGHLCEISRTRVVQELEEAGATPVDAAANVGDDVGVGWVALAEAGDLAVEVRRLLGRGDARVDDALLLRGGICVGNTKELAEVVVVVLALPTGRRDDAHLFFSRPATKGGVGKVELLKDGRG